MPAAKSTPGTSSGNHGGLPDPYPQDLEVLLRTPAFLATSADLSPAVLIEDTVVDAVDHSA